MKELVKNLLKLGAPEEKIDIILGNLAESYELFSEDIWVSETYEEYETSALDTQVKKLIRLFYKDNESDLDNMIALSPTLMLRFYTAVFISLLSDHVLGLKNFVEFRKYLNPKAFEIVVNSKISASKVDLDCYIKNILNNDNLENLLNSKLIESLSVSSETICL